MYIFFDTETNGLWRRDLNPEHKDQPRLVSIAYQVCDDDEKVIAQQSCRIEPNKKFVIPKEASAINGITTKEAQRTGIKLELPLATMTYFMSKCHTMVAHNLAFDLQILVREFNQLGYMYKTPENLHCTMMSAKNEMKLKSEFNDYKFPKLSECFTYFFHGGTQNYHDALLDVQLCRELYFHLKHKKIELLSHQEIPKELLKRIDGEKYKSLVKFLHAIDYEKLNQWEGDFCKSLIDKLDKFDEHILLSNKQHDVIRNIYTKHNGK